jgi:hypothetical protein
MSILKGILHHWNKTSSAYDTIHPETEVAQVTDWNKGIVSTLASTGLSNLVNVLSSDSLLALLIKKVFDAMGVKYSLGQNGYVCWGSLFGGVITQWGMGTITGTGYVTFPLLFSDTNYKFVTTAFEDTTNGLNYKISPGTKSTDKIYVAMYLNGAHSTYPASFDWIALR